MHTHAHHARSPFFTWAARVVATVWGTVVKEEGKPLHVVATTDHDRLVLTATADGWEYQLLDAAHGPQPTTLCVCAPPEEGMECQRSGSSTCEDMHGKDGQCPATKGCFLQGTPTTPQHTTPHNRHADPPLPPSHTRPHPRPLLGVPMGPADCVEGFAVPTSASACADVALRHGYALGTATHEFAADLYPTKGCYSYAAGKHSRSAFFGSGADQPAAMVAFGDAINRSPDNDPKQRQVRLPCVPEGTGAPPAAAS